MNRLNNRSRIIYILNRLKYRIVFQFPKDNFQRGRSTLLLAHKWFTRSCCLLATGWTKARSRSGRKRAFFGRDLRLILLQACNCLSSCLLTKLDGNRFLILYILLHLLTDDPFSNRIKAFHKNINPSAL